MGKKTLIITLNIEYSGINLTKDVHFLHTEKLQNT